MWDPSDFDDCSEVRLKPNDIWKPNIIMFNSDDGDFKSYIQGLSLTYRVCSLTRTVQSKKLKSKHKVQKNRKAYRSSIPAG